MLDGVESITTQVLSLALDAASARQQMIARNIANANTVGYTPQRLEFGDQVAQMQQSLQTQKSLDTYSLSQFVYRTAPVVDANGRPEKVQLDAEVASLAQNAVQYQALIAGLNKHFSILSVAVSDGK
jgi:flagellar basal-body rod protein FlgB